MKISSLCTYALSACAAAAMLAGCAEGSGTPLSPSPAGVTADQTHSRPAYSVLYSFKGGTGDGADPYAGLMNVKGTLYGTTPTGGANGDGTVFAITAPGVETVLHSFGGSGDGIGPEAGLINVSDTLFNSTFFGTTEYGGANGKGTVFSIAPSGTETVLYSFKGGSEDGAFPYAGLINVKGTLYGTTMEGGSSACYSVGCGTVFKIAKSGKEIVVYSFKGGYGDGEYPAAALANVNGTLFGTTPSGGRSLDGTVFAVTTSGTESVLHNFNIIRRDNGAYPYAGLMNVKGALYGTTRQGGGSNFGTVFSITPSHRSYALLLRFNLTDGAFPHAGLINLKGTLYGTTEVGGANNEGSVFSISSSGADTVLHSFGGSGDGAYPLAGLINVKGTLYGTTYAGGSGSCSFSGYSGCGTVFSVTP